MNRHASTEQPVGADRAPCADRASLVQVDRRHNCTCATLAAPALRRLEAALRPWPWLGDRWTRPVVRAAAFETLRSEATRGLVLIGPGMHFRLPPPFVEAFEPIQFGTHDDQLKVLSGDAPTAQEQRRWVIAIVLVLAGVLFVAPLALLFLRGGAGRALQLFSLFAGILVVTFGFVWASQRIFQRWYLLPSAVAVVRPYRTEDRRLELFTRTDSYGLLRYVHTGKTTILVLELRSLDGRRSRRSVSEREAISFLAAWQSPQAPPPIAQIRALFE